jgi:hypothetical protein
MLVLDEADPTSVTVKTVIVWWKIINFLLW